MGLGRPLDYAQRGIVATGKGKTEHVSALIGEWATKDGKLDFSVVTNPKEIDRIERELEKDAKSKDVLDADTQAGMVADNIKKAGVTLEAKTLPRALRDALIARGVDVHIDDNVRKWDERKAKKRKADYSVTDYPSFHAWSGDWENRNIYEKLHGEPIVSVESGVIKAEPGEKGAIAAAKRWILQHPQAPAHTEIGDVTIDADSMKGSLSHSRYQRKLDVLPILRSSLEQGEYLGTLPDWSREGGKDHYFAAKVNIGGDDKILFIRVLEPAGLNKSLYVHEIYTDDELNKNGGNELVPGMQTGNLASAKNGNHSDFFRKIIRLFYSASMESTKCVDSDGKPLVVWRRDNETINTYDFDKTQKTDAGWLGKGFYFYGDKVEAERAYGYGKNLRGFYLNAKNPYYISDEEHSELAKANDKDKSAEFTERLKEEGYDSVFYNGDLRQEWVVFEPNQIKSAEEMTYDDYGKEIPSYMRFSKSDDIRYSVTTPRMAKTEQVNPVTDPTSLKMRQEYQGVLDENEMHEVFGLPEAKEYAPRILARYGGMEGFVKAVLDGKIDINSKPVYQHIVHWMVRGGRNAFEKNVPDAAMRGRFENKNVEAGRLEGRRSTGTEPPSFARPP